MSMFYLNLNFQFIFQYHPFFHFFFFNYIFHSFFYIQNPISTFYFFLHPPSSSSSSSSSSCFHFHCIFLVPFYFHSYFLSSLYFYPLFYLPVSVLSSTNYSFLLSLLPFLYQSPFSISFYDLFSSVPYFSIFYTYVLPVLPLPLRLFIHVPLPPIFPVFCKLQLFLQFLRNFFFFCFPSHFAFASCRLITNYTVPVGTNKAQTSV